MPFDATNISDSYSAFTGLVAGFAFAAMFLLIERVQTAPKKETRDKYLQSMLALFVAFVCGGLSSFLFAGIAGDSPDIALRTFTITSAVLVLLLFVILYGICTMLSALEVNRVVGLARNVSYIVIIFSSLRLANTFWIVGVFAGASSTFVVIIFAIFFLQLVAFLLRHKPKWNFFAYSDRNKYLYAILLASFGIGSIETLAFAPDPLQGLLIGAETGIFAATMFLITLLATWTIAILPD